MHARPGSILFDHVACGVSRIDEIAPLLEFELGAAAYRGGPGIGFRGGQWAFAGEGRLELIEPDGAPGGFLHRFLNTHGPGIHHVTFKVPDIHAARDRAIGLGYNVIGFRDEQPAWKECFLHPKQAGGIVVQMAEVDPEAEEADWLPLDGVITGTPRRTVTLRGLRLLTRDLERSRRCWLDLLGGTAETTQESGFPEEVFRWPGSPLELRVVHDLQASEEGPVALEFAPFADEFPEPLPQLLGATLLQV